MPKTLKRNNLGLEIWKKRKPGDLGAGIIHQRSDPWAWRRILEEKWRSMVGLKLEAAALTYLAKNVVTEYCRRQCCQLSCCSSADNDLEPGGAETRVADGCPHARLKLEEDSLHTRRCFKKGGRRKKIQELPLTCLIARRADQLWRLVSKNAKRRYHKACSAKRRLVEDIQTCSPMGGSSNTRWRPEVCTWKMVQQAERREVWTSKQNGGSAGRLEDAGVKKRLEALRS